MIINDQCTLCLKLHFSRSEHACPPKWQVCDPHWYEGTEGDPYEWTDIYADSASKAAESFCAQMDSHDSSYDRNYYAQNDGCSVLWIKDSEGTLFHYRVEAEMLPSYIAVELPIKPMESHTR